MVKCARTNVGLGLAAAISLVLIVFGWSNANCVSRCGTQPLCIVQCVGLSVSVCVGEHAVCVVDDSSVGAGFVLVVVETGAKHSTFACDTMNISFDIH